MFENGLGIVYNISFHILLYVFELFTRMAVCVLGVYRVCGDQKRFGSLRTGVIDGYVAMWVLVVEPGFSGRTSSIPGH